MKLIIFLFAASVSVLAQGGQVQVGVYGVQYVNSAPTGSCSANSPQQNVVGTGAIYTCQNGTWASGGGGTTISCVGLLGIVSFPGPSCDSNFTDDGNGNVTLGSLTVGPPSNPGIITMLGTGNTAPANPAANSARLWVNTTSGLIQCLYSSGASCFGIQFGQVSAGTNTNDLVMGSGGRFSGLLGSAFDFSACCNNSLGGFKIPAFSGFVASGTQHIGIDSGAPNLHGWTGLADVIIPGFTSAPANGDCTSISNILGRVLLSDFGAGCGLTLQTNGVSNTSQTALNHINSTANTSGLNFTFSNPATSSEKGEIGGTVNATSGGTGQDTHTATGVAQVNSGTWSVNAALPNTPTTATTQTAGDSTGDVATDSFVATAVSNAIAAVNPAVAVLAASTAALTGTYSNGASGIGATFTVTATGAFTLDGIAINTIGQRVLLKNQASSFQNGVYTATIVGATGVSPVFTRALDYDQSSDMNNTGAIPVQSGTVNTTTMWLQTSQVTTVGTDAVTFAEFSINPSTQVVNNAANTATSAMTLDMRLASASALNVPSVSGCASTNNSVCYDTLNSNFHFQGGGADALGAFEATAIAVNTLPKSQNSSTSRLTPSCIKDDGTVVTCTAEVFFTGNTVRLTADSSGITALTPGTTFLTFNTLKASTNLSFHCALRYSQATGATTVGFAIQGATNAPTRIDAQGIIYTNNTGTSVESDLVNLTSTTATAIVSGTASATATDFHAYLDGTIQIGASLTTVNILAFTGNASDAVTMKAGSYCTAMP